MSDISLSENQIQVVSNFDDLINLPFQGNINAICWNRELEGDFAEIVSKLELKGNITEIDTNDLIQLTLSEAGELAREVLLKDMHALKAHGASPSLNVIEYYERDDAFPLFPTDVYSYHVDRSPVPTYTFLCTYHGESSDILPNSQSIQKILVPEILSELKKLHDGLDEDFDSFLSEYFFDLHYQALPHAQPISLGVGNLWRLAVDHPQSEVLPCLHRAPVEKTGQVRLLLIC